MFHNIDTKIDSRPYPQILDQAEKFWLLFVNKARDYPMKVLTSLV